MQKSIWLAAALLLSLFISGCGGGTTTTSVIGSTTDKLATSDINGKTFHIVDPKSTSITTFHTYSGSGATRTWSTDPPDLSAMQGTWSVSAVDGTVTLTASDTSKTKTIQSIQKVYKADKTTLDYWLVSFSGQSANCRMYIDTTPATTAFRDYTSSAAFKNVLIGGAIQKTAIQGFSNISSNISTITGVTGKSGFVDYNPTALTAPAQFGRPIGITTTDGTNFFVLDNATNVNVIRMLYPDGKGGTYVKTLKTSAGTNITFNTPGDITTDGTNLYVTDSGNYVIQKLTPAADGSWTMTTLAGYSGTTGALDGTGNTYNSSGMLTATGTARFGLPIGITTDGTNLYVTDNEAIRKVVISTGEVTTLAGYLGSAGWTADNINGTNARFNMPLRITTDGTNLYVADCNNYVIRKIVIATGVVTTFAGSPGKYGTKNDTGTSALFNGPNGITTDGKNLYVTDWGPVTSSSQQAGQIIRKIEIATQIVSTIAGTNNSIGSDHSHFNCPVGITTDGISLYVADMLNYTIRRVK